MADRRIQSLSQQLRCLQCCSDPDCTGLRECRVCVSGASAEEEPNELEEGTVMNMDYEKLSKVAETESSVVPCCVQHADTKEVLIIAYVNDEALAHSRETKVRRPPHPSRRERRHPLSSFSRRLYPRLPALLALVPAGWLAERRRCVCAQIATFWSTSRNELWVKGLTSGDQLDLVEIRVNCEQSTPRPFPPLCAAGTRRDRFLTDVRRFAAVSGSPRQGRRLPHKGWQRQHAALLLLPDAEGRRHAGDAARSQPVAAPAHLVHRRSVTTRSLQKH